MIFEQQGRYGARKHNVFGKFVLSCLRLLTCVYLYFYRPSQFSASLWHSKISIVTAVHV
jgi:hypothetical protein